MKPNLDHMKLITLFICSIMITQSALAQLSKKLDSVLSAATRPGEPGIALSVESN